MNRQMNADLLALYHALQVDMHHDIARRMHLHVLHDRMLGLAARGDLNDRRIELFIADHRQQILLIEYELLRFFMTAVKNGWHLARVTQAAARTFALRLAEVRAESE